MLIWYIVHGYLKPSQFNTKYTVSCSAFIPKVSPTLFNKLVSELYALSAEWEKKKKE